MRRLIDLSVTQFVDELSQARATPGGGSAAALAGSMAAALVGMAAGLSAKKKGLEAYAVENEARAQTARDLARELSDLVDADAEAFDGIVAASRLPKVTDEEKAARRAALRQATLHAARIPLKTETLCLALSELLAPLVAHGNPACASDVAAAALLAQAGADAAFRNVAINLDSLAEDDAEAPALRREAEAALAHTRALTEAVLTPKP